MTKASLTGTRMADTLNTIQLFGRSDPFDGGHKIKSVKDATGNAPPLTISWTTPWCGLICRNPWKRAISLRFQLTGGITSATDKWIANAVVGNIFRKTKNYIYTIAQWFPRMCVYDDVEGWQNKQFLGQGEFALTFGDYKVKLTVPSDHIVAATGTLMNPATALNKTQQAFWKAKTTFDKPVIIATQAEAIEREKPRQQPKDLGFHATNVRDFAFCNIAQIHLGRASRESWKQNSAGHVVLSKKAIRCGNKNQPKQWRTVWRFIQNIQLTTLIQLPFPWTQPTLVWSIPWFALMAVVRIRPAKLLPMFGKHSCRYHSWSWPQLFPMIINNDERQWTWMDRG